jgi:hypothetical protein
MVACVSGLEWRVFRIKPSTFRLSARRSSAMASPKKTAGRTKGRAARGSAEKFRELLLYVATRSEGDPHFGATKLNKILFYADFWAYKKLGKPITGQPYQRLGRGPAPKKLLPVTRKMEKAGDCAWVVRDHFGLPQKRLVALRAPDLSRFSGEEISIVDSVLRELEPFNATEVSELSHRFLGWQLARDKEEIPYSTVFLGEPRTPTIEEIEFGRELADRVSSRARG